MVYICQTPGINLQKSSLGVGRDFSVFVFVFLLGTQEVHGHLANFSIKQREDFMARDRTANRSLWFLGTSSSNFGSSWTVVSPSLELCNIINSCYKLHFLPTKVTCVIWTL